MNRIVASMVKIILCPLFVSFFLNMIFGLFERTVAAVLMVPFMIDEFRAWKGGFVITHLENFCKLDHRKDTSTLGSQRGGRIQYATYGLRVICDRLLPKAPPPAICQDD